ncbi:MAG: hydrogenase accessory protein HypB [Gammaproteobacteria bacterium]|nr:MAG: hydrogenase accessory protein HypB [Gammaproteobacteria bacterium]
MCATCGCGEGEVKIDGEDHNHHSHTHTTSNKRIVQIETDILEKNNQYANQNRVFFKEHKIFALNLVSSPGSGKTSLLCKTLDDLKNKYKLSVIEGDQQTDNDAKRIQKTGCPAVQINTGKGCHLDAHMVGHSLERLKPEKDSYLFIENVGNLVCPASFDLGEAKRVVILSVTEGEDKPIKYPDMFADSDLMLLNKIDLLPHLDYSLDKVYQYVNKINPKMKIIQVSATTGESMDLWYQWLEISKKTEEI